MIASFPLQLIHSLCKVNNMVVNLKNSYTVKPSEPTPMVKLWLPDVDQVQALTHAPTVYIYPSHLLTNTTKTPESSVLQPIQLLKDSLSQVLVHFYPLAGRLGYINGGRLELDCNAMGAELFEAESDSTIEDFGDFTPTPQLRQLVPVIDYTKPIHEIPILLVQLTKLKCGSLVLGTAASHNMVDGLAAIHFFNSWAKISRGEAFGDDEKPILDRTILRAADPHRGPNFCHTEFEHPPFLVGKSDDLEERSKATTVSMLKLTKEQIEKLKQNANADRTEDDGRGRLYSRYVAVAAHMWRCACKARGHVNEQESALRITLDGRNRLLPPLSPRYFGNVIFMSNPIGKAGELLSRPLSYASGKVREGAQVITDDYIKSALNFLKNQPDLSKFRKGFHTVGCTQGDFLGNPNLAVTSWMGLPIYGADFGWGKPIHMGPAGIGYDGKSFVIPGDEDGSLVIALRLQVDHMDSFKNFFYEDI